MDKISAINEYFAEVETTEEQNGYFFSVGEALTIVILGSICGLKNVNQIHQWAKNQRISEFLEVHFSIRKIPCYDWFLCLLKIIDVKSLNQCLMKWAQSFIPETAKKLTLSFDGKTIRSTGKMDKYDSALHIVSAHVAELGITIGQQTVANQENKIPAVRELIGMLKVEGCMVVADALNCQKDTAKAIVKAKADYLLSVKDNQPTLKKDIEDYMQDRELQKAMDICKVQDKRSGRIERRTAYSTCDTAWLFGKENWAGLACIGAINTQFTTKKGTSNEWHYYISSRELTARELLTHARLEWSVEAMHWLLDVHYEEDFCRIEDENIQQCLNMVRKIALNNIRWYKEKTKSRLPLSKIMFDCLLDCNSLLHVLETSVN